MEKIKFKEENIQKMMKALKRALDRLDKNTENEDIEFLYDSIVARFKILIESVWKHIKLSLEQQGFLDVPSSPKGVLHFAREVNFLFQNEYDKLIDYLALRNLASHLYDEPQYALVAQAVPEAYRVIKQIIGRLAI